MGKLRFRNWTGIRSHSKQWVRLTEALPALAAPTGSGGEHLGSRCSPTRQVGAAITSWRWENLSKCIVNFQFIQLYTFLHSFMHLLKILLISLTLGSALCWALRRHQKGSKTWALSQEHSFWIRKYRSTNIFVLNVRTGARLCEENNWCVGSLEVGKF